MGGVLPEFQVPQLHTGGFIKKEGLFELAAGEAVVPGMTEFNKSKQPIQQNVELNITSPTEVADPNWLATRIAWEMKHER